MFALLSMAVIACLTGDTHQREAAQFQITAQGGHVLVQGQGFHAEAEVVKYDGERNGQLILEGEVTLWRRRGKAEETIKGTRIVYWWKTRDVQVNSSRISGQP